MTLTPNCCRIFLFVFIFAPSKKCKSFNTYFMHICNRIKFVHDLEVKEASHELNKSGDKKKTSLFFVFF